MFEKPSTVCFRAGFPELLQVIYPAGDLEMGAFRMFKGALVHGDQVRRGTCANHVVFPSFFELLYIVYRSIHTMADLSMCIYIYIHIEK